MNITTSLNGMVSAEASTLTKNLLTEIGKVEQRFQQNSRKWSDEALDVLRFCVGAGEGLTLGTIYTLYIIKTHWDDLPLDFRKQYEYQFNVLVVRETPVKPETLDNYFRAVKTFIVEGKKPFGTVEVPKRDKYGNEVFEEGEIISEQKEFDPVEIPITKLTLMRSAVENNQMDDRRWSMLADPGVTPSDLRYELYKKDESSETDPSRRFYLMGDVIIVAELGEEVVIGRIDFSQYGDNETATSAIRHLARCLGIKLEEDNIEVIKKHKFLERYNANGSSKAEDQSQGE